MSHPTRVCIGCTGVDDHPRHVMIGPDGTDLPMHMDCCAMARNCKVCEGQLAGVGGIKKNPKGDALRAHLETLGPGPDQPGWTAPSDQSREG